MWNITSGFVRGGWHFYFMFTLSFFTFIWNWLMPLTTRLQRGKGRSFFFFFFLPFCWSCPMPRTSVLASEQTVNRCHSGLTIFFFFFSVFLLIVSDVKGERNRERASSQPTGTLCFISYWWFRESFRPKTANTPTGFTRYRTYSFFFSCVLALFPFFFARRGCSIVIYVHPLDCFCFAWSL